MRTVIESLTVPVVFQGEVEAHVYLDGLLRLRLPCPREGDAAVVPAVACDGARPGSRLALRLASARTGDEAVIDPERAVAGFLPDELPARLTWGDVAGRCLPDVLVTVSEETPADG